MKTNFKLLAALLAMAFLSSSAFAQQSGSRRNNEDSKRQVQKVERQQTKVDKVQTPTNIVNQPVTDQKVRDAQGTRPGSNPPSGNYGGSSGSTRPGGNPPSGGYGSSGSGNRPGGNPPSGNYGGSSGSTRPGGNPPSGSYGNSGGTRPGSNPPSGNYGGGNRPPMPPGGYDESYSRRPAIAPEIKYNRTQIFERTNASSIVVYTNFFTKAEAYDYIERLLDYKAYTVYSYGNNYNWLMSDVAFIPTPFDWTNPMTHNQFRMKFYISRVSGAVKVTITAEWRESYLSTAYSKLRFQPSNRYSTYYAWNVLEDFASSIPHRSVVYR